MATTEARHRRLSRLESLGTLSVDGWQAACKPGRPGLDSWVCQPPTPDLGPESVFSEPQVPHLQVGQRYLPRGPVSA